MQPCRTSHTTIVAKLVEENPTGVIERGSSNHLPSFALFFELFATWVREIDPNDLSKCSIYNLQK